MGEPKKEPKTSVSSNAKQAISRRILLAEDNKTIKDIVVPRLLNYIVATYLIVFGILGFVR